MFDKPYVLRYAVPGAGLSAARQFRDLGAALAAFEVAKATGQAAELRTWDDIRNRYVAQLTTEPRT